MAGNVWEWTWDLYGSYASAAQTDPRGPAPASTNRVFRGGAWGGGNLGTRSAVRGLFGPIGRSNFVDFRPARSSVP